MLTLKLFPNRTLTQTLILTPKKVNKKAQMNISHFRFILFNLKIFGEIVTTNIVPSFLLNPGAVDSLKCLLNTNVQSMSFTSAVALTFAIGWILYALLLCVQ